MIRRGWCIYPSPDKSSRRKRRDLGIEKGKKAAVMNLYRKSLLPKIANSKVSIDKKKKNIQLLYSQLNTDLSKFETQRLGKMDKALITQSPIPKSKIILSKAQRHHPNCKSQESFPNLPKNISKIIKSSKTRKKFRNSDLSSSILHKKYFSTTSNNCS